jgi:uncharacterized protein YkwD
LPNLKNNTVSIFLIRIKLAIKNHMKLQYLKLSLILFFTLLHLTACKENLVSNNKTTYQENLEKEVHMLINIHRTSIGLEELEWNETIAIECRIHSNNLAAIRAINHDGFNERINKIRETISLNWAGENVALNWSSHAAVTSWLNSPGHKSNIESNSNLTGVGVAFDVDSAMYLTQIFVRSSE